MSRPSRAGFNSSSASRSTPSSRVTGVLGDNYRFICSVVENRMREIGLAVINLTRPEIELSSFTDNYCYVNVLTKLTIYSPQEILLPKTTQVSELESIITARYPNSTVIPISRKYFDETRGIKYISQFAIPGATICSEISEKYLCQAAIAALVKYAEFTQKITFASHSLKISYVGGEGTMIIDSGTLCNLEVLCNSKTGSVKESLFGVLNYTKTKAGGTFRKFRESISFSNTMCAARLLRVNLCQPPKDENTINTRLDCVEELLNNEGAYFAISTALLEVPNLDRIVSQLVTIDKNSPDSKLNRGLSNILHLKRALERFPILYKALETCENELFKAMRRNFNDKRASVMLNQIAELINEEVEPSKQTLQMQMQQCFAILPGKNGMLDVARKTYSEAVEDINGLETKYKETYKLDKLKLKYSTKRGYYLSLNSFVGVLPDIFIQVLQQKKTIKFSTEELISLNERQKEAMKEILQISNRLLEDLFHQLRGNIACIYNINDTIALLDTICSFVTFITLNENTIRPILRKQGPINIVSGRHPIAALAESANFVPNDTFANENSNLMIITGPNMSGKSTYIRQVALITIVAQIGCFVPALSCQLRITDHLFSRIGTGDSIEDNASSFMLEMKDMSYILQTKSESSLIIIDELGRGTSISDGCSLAWSFCEYLLSSKAYIFFVTHFVELSQLESIYSNVRLFHLTTSSNNSKLTYAYHIRDGISTTPFAGILLAQQAGFPSLVVKTALNIHELLKSREDTVAKNNRMRVYSDVYKSLQNLQYSTLDEGSLRSYLQSLKDLIIELTS